MSKIKNNRIDEIKIMKNGQEAKNNRLYKCYKYNSSV